MRVAIGGAVDLQQIGEDAGKLAGLEPLGVTITGNLQGLLEQEKVDVLVDFTSPMAIMKNIETSLARKVTPVVGTTGINENDLQQIKKWIEQYGTGAIVVPNFALGAILMMKLAQICARFFPQVEIIELHHNGKVDAPSGTAIKSAQLINEARFEHFLPGNSWKNTRSQRRISREYIFTCTPAGTGRPSGDHLWERGRSDHQT